MELTQILTVVIAVFVAASAEENLAIGQVFMQSSQANYCMAPTNLVMSANVSGLSPDSCTCAMTNGSYPLNENDWMIIRVQSQSLVRAVSITGNSGAVDVLVGDHFSNSSDLDKFSLCTRYSSNNGLNVSCLQPVVGGFVALRALDTQSILRLCNVQVFGQSGNLLKTGSKMNWTMVPDLTVDQQWRLVDNDESTCVSIAADLSRATNVSLRLSLLQMISSELRVKVVFNGIPSSALPPVHAARASGRECSVVRATSSSLEFVCTCTQPCRGRINFVLMSISAGQTLTICEVIAVADESAVVRAFDECKGPVVPIGIADSDGRFEDDMFAASSSSASGPCAAPSHARLNHVTPAAATDSSSWCASSAVASWLSIDLGTLFKIRAVVIQGGGSTSFGGAFVTSFSISYALGSGDWIPYTENRTTKVFQGVSDISMPVLRSFASDLVASRIRINALAWNIRPCLRFELIGCRLIAEEWTSNIRQVISGPSGIPNSRLQVSSVYFTYAPKEKSRLGSLLQCTLYGSWCPGSNTVSTEWIQFDLADTRSVHGFYWKGREGLSYYQYVTTYSIQYSRTASGALVAYPIASLSTGITDITSTFYLDMLVPFDAQIVRIVPTANVYYQSVRIDMHVAPKNPTLITMPAGSYNGTTSTQSIPPLRPIGLWPLSEYHGFRDLSFNRQHGSAGSDVNNNVQGVFNTPKTTVIHNNGAVAFMGTVNSYVDIPLQWNFSSLKTFTVVVDMYLTNYGRILTFTPTTNGSLSISISSSNTLNFLVLSTGSLLYISATVPLNTWFQMAVTCNTMSGTCTTYVNGVQQNQINIGLGAQLMSSSSLRLGTADATRLSFNGRLRCLQIFNRVLLSFEMSNAGQRCVPTTTRGLLGLWPLNGDLQNYVHPTMPASSNQTQFVPGPRLRLNSRVRALKTNGTTNTTLTVAGPLKVNGAYTVMFHAKVAPVTGTLLQLLSDVGIPVVTVNMNGYNAAVSSSSVSLSSTTCFSAQGTHVAFRLDTAAQLLSLFCNGTSVAAATVPAAMLSEVQSFTSMQLAKDISASLACVMLFERALTDLEIATYTQYCPFRPDDVYGRRSTPKRHCGEWLNSGYLKNDMYIVDPDGADGPVEPFTVFCNMSDSFNGLRGATVVRHYMATSLDASQLSTIIPIGYEAKMDQLQAFLSASVYCRQWISFACTNSAINQGSQQVLKWLSRDSVAQSGWGGTTTGCPCYQQQTCAGGASGLCNCDKIDGIQREDSGWITDRSLLPVIQVAATVTTMQGRVTVGDLICYT